MKLSHHGWALAGLVLVVLVTFQSVLLPPRAVIANDSPLGSIARGQRWWQEGRRALWLNDGYLGRNGGRLSLGIVTPVQRLVPAAYYNTVIFAGTTLVVGIGMYLLCVTLGLGALASFAGASALMLSGDFITCVFSGHGGKFVMWACLLLCLWLLTYGVTRRNVLALAWSGICGGIGVSGQLDVGFIVALFFLGWLLFLVWQTRLKRQWAKLAGGLILALGAGMIYAVMTIVSLAGLAAQGTSGISDDDRSPAEQWNWATQWSLPKAETLSLLAPGFFGWGHLPDSPYWGRIGQDARWPAEHVGFPRFSINTQGLGVAVIALALLAVCAACVQRTNETGGTMPTARGVMMFWSIAALVALVFAWGRYFDTAPNSASGIGAYRLFYALPKMDAMRNPLKFLYPLMLAVALLAAYGMDALSTLIAAAHSHAAPHSAKRKK